jgi:4-amino-4-deoxy-L-arabinose transferase-like glycosyltransferase
VTELVRRLLGFVPTRRAAILLFAVALGVFWFQALGWPMAKGRDTWDYLVYYLQLLDSEPPLSQVQLFRAPLTPLAVGLPVDVGGTVLLEVVFGLFFAVSVVAWSATALVFGRIPALASAVLLLVYPAWATLYHQASSDAVFATGLALWALLLARTLRRPTTGGFVALGAGIAALVLIRPANQVLLPAALAPLLAVAPWRRRLTWVAACVAAAVVPLGAWAVHNEIRYDDLTVTRGGRAWVPFLRVWLADGTIAPENGPASRRLARLIEDKVLTEEPFRSLDVPLDAYLANGSNYETVRLIALSDRVLGRDTNYDVLFDSAVEAIREHPGAYARGVAGLFWDFLMQRPIREAGAPRAQTAPEAPRPTFESDGVTLPNPQATVLVDAVPYGFVWCASDFLDSCTLPDPSLVWDDPAGQERYREVVSQVRAWDADLPSRTGQTWVTEILNRITPRFPRPPLWLAVGAVALLWRRPQGWRTIVVLWVTAALVLLIHAASQGLAPEFALPLYPLFIVTALGALGGERAPRSGPT